MTTKTAFVTGGSKGIGLATATALADEGYKVYVGSRSEPTDLDGRLSWIACDVTSTESVDQAFTKIEEAGDAVEILVANAGITNDGLMLRMSEADFTKVIDANLTGAFRCAKRAVKSMMKARYGRIVFLSSVVGVIGQVGQANYAASKAGLKGLARTMAREFASRGITVNLVAPGPIETDMLAAVSDEAKEAMVSAVPAGRAGQVHEVAAAIRYLVSEDAGYVTGATIPVDGGLGMGG